jgi:hypothetical protein
LLARGYGLAVAQPDGGLRRRPAWHAFRTLIVELSGSIFTGPVATPDGAWMYRFEHESRTVVVAWSLERGVTADLPARPIRATSRDGDELPVPDGTRVELGPSPVYYALDEAPTGSGPSPVAS